MAKENGTGVVLGISNFILKLLLNVIFYGVLVFLVFKIGTESYKFCYSVFGDVRAVSESNEELLAVVTIKSGESTMGVASKLEDYGLITDKYAFYVKAQLFNYNIMPGAYIVSNNMNYTQILETITDRHKSIVDEDRL